MGSSIDANSNKLDIMTNQQESNMKQMNEFIDAIAIRASKLEKDFMEQSKKSEQINKCVLDAQLKVKSTEESLSRKILAIEDQLFNL